MTNSKFNWTIIIVVLIIVIGFLYGISMFNPADEKTVRANGAAELKSLPDSVSVSILVQTKALKAEDAKNENAEATDKILSKLKGLNIDSIGTENYNIYPEYDWSSGKQKLKGYTSSNYIKAETSDFDTVGNIVDYSVDNGGLINYINFELSSGRRNEIKAEVLSKAAEDAKSKAEAIASGLGKRIGDVVSVTTNDYGYMPYPLYREEGNIALESAVEKISTQISPGQLDVSATVEVVYELK